MMVTALESASRVFSTMQTASAPSGNGAPVMIRTACPGPTVPSNRWPAATEPITWSRAGAAAVSAARRAYPSMDEFANGGTSSLDTMSSLRTHPSASLSAILCGGRDAHREITQHWASASGITPSRRWSRRRHRATVGKAFVIALHPYRAARPCFAFPDRHRSFDGFDALLRRREGRSSVWSRSRDHDGHLADGQDPDSVEQDQTTQLRPLRPSGGGNMSHPRHDVLRVGLVLEARDSATPIRVVAHGATEGDNAAARRERCPSPSDVDRQFPAADGDPVVPVRRRQRTIHRFHLSTLGLRRSLAADISGRPVPVVGQ